MKTFIKVIIGIAVIVVVVLVVMPYMLMGAPLPLFSITNQHFDNHEVMVEILDFNNKSVFNETYKLGPEERISYPENVWEKEIKWPKGEYTFKVTLDGKVMRTYRETVDTWKLTSISINRNGDLEIGTIVV